MFSNTEVIVAEIVMTQYIVASLSLSVITSMTNLPKFMSNLLVMAGRIDFIHAVLEAINKYYLNTGKFNRLF